ncbi:MAG: TetR/AcrR family transcriptional regulator, partial [Salibacteraceae bacterium]
MPRSKEEFERIRLASKKKILEAAQQLFATKGYAHTSIQSIASKSGIAKSSVYHHFKTKEDILVSLLDEFYQSWSKTVHFTDDFQDPKKHLTAIIESTIRHIKDNREAYRMLEEMHRVVFEDPEIIERTKKIGEEKMITFMNIFQKLGVDDVEGELYFFNSTFRG